VNNEAHLNQLELPGDLWNEEFRKTYLKRLKETEPKSLRRIITNDSRISARRLFHWLHQHSKWNKRVSKENLFPVYLDVTYSLRRSNLDYLMNNSNEIKLKIESEIGNLKNEKDVINAYNIIRQKLSKKVY